jgi:hypothetical protein
MHRGSFELKNDSDSDMIFQIEPDCWTFTLKNGESATVEYKYDREPATMQLTNPAHGVHGAIIPGDGDVCVKKAGKDVLEGI